MRRPLADKRIIGPVIEVNEELEGRYIVEIKPMLPEGDSSNLDIDNIDSSDPVVEFKGEITTRKDVTIPARVRRRHNINQGDRVAFAVTNFKGDKRVREVKTVTRRNSIGLSDKTKNSPMDELDLSIGDRVSIMILKVDESM